MSGFWGIFRPDGGQVDKDAFTQMCRASERKGFDGMETHVEDGIAMGHLMLRVSPESEYDKQPLKSDCGNYMLVGHFRLDYRDELGDKLGLTQMELEIIPDSRLALMAYIKWKEKCVYHLEGDWAFVLFNKSLSQVILFKDKYGYSALFYTLKNRELYFSSDLNNLIELHCLNAEIDFNLILNKSLTHLSVDEGQTPFLNIYHIRSSCYLVIDSQKEPKQITYWKTDLKVNYRFKHDQDCFDTMFSLIANAILSRVKTDKNVALYLSAGLDSTTVAFFSSFILKYFSKTLNSYTSFPAFLDFDKSTDSFRFREDIHVEQFVKRFDNVKSNCLNFPEIKYSQIFKNQEKYDFYDYVLTPNSYWLEGILDDAKCINVKTILNGQLGNFVVSWNAPKFDLYLLLTFQFKTLFRRISYSIVQPGFSFLNYFKVRFYRPLYIYINNIFQFLFFEKANEMQSFFKKDQFAKNHIHITSKIGKIKLSPLLILNPRKLRAFYFNQNTKDIGMKWYLSGHKNSVHCCDPLSDERVVNFSFGIEEELFDKNQIVKYLVKGMMKDKIPDFILLEKRSFIQSIDIGVRIKNDESLIRFLEKVNDNQWFSEKFNIEMSLKEISKLSISATPLNYRKTSTLLLNKLSILYFCENYLTLQKKRNDKRF